MSSIAVVFSPDITKVSDRQVKYPFGKALHPAADAGVLFIGGIPEGSSYVPASLVSSRFSRVTGTQIRFLGYGNRKLNSPNPGYLTCGEWRISRYVPTYGLGTVDSPRFDHGIQLGAHHDRTNGTNDRDAWMTPNRPMICQGDSGGPVFALDGGVYKLAGVSSISHPVCEIYSYGTAADLTRQVGRFLLEAPIPKVAPPPPQTTLPRDGDLPKDLEVLFDPPQKGRAECGGSFWCMYKNGVNCGVSKRGICGNPDCMYDPKRGCYSRN